MGYTFEPGTDDECGNLLLMRGEARREELAVRAALEADRGRLVRQVLAESLVLAIAASAWGLHSGGGVCRR